MVETILSVRLFGIRIPRDGIIFVLWLHKSTGESVKTYPEKRKGYAYNPRKILEQLHGPDWLLESGFIEQAGIWDHQV